METLKLDTTGMSGFVPEEELSSLLERAQEADSSLLAGEGPDPGYLGWLQLPDKMGDAEVDALLAVVEEVRSKREVLVVIGIGGSYLGARAAIDALTPSFGRNGTDVVFAGCDLTGDRFAELMDYLDGKDRELFLINGGLRTLESYQEDRPKQGGPLVPPAHMGFFQSLKSFIELYDYYILHAGFRPGLGLTEQSAEDMVWIRDDFIYSEYDFGKRVIFGHTPFHQPLVMENKIGLDTGAVYGNRLTSLELPEFRFHSVGA